MTTVHPSAQSKDALLHWHKPMLDEARASAYRLKRNVESLWNCPDLPDLERRKHHKSLQTMVAICAKLEGMA